MNRKKRKIRAKFSLKLHLRKKSRFLLVKPLHMKERERLNCLQNNWKRLIMCTKHPWSVRLVTKMSFHKTKRNLYYLKRSPATHQSCPKSKPHIRVGDRFKKRDKSKDKMITEYWFKEPSVDCWSFYLRSIITKDLENRTNQTTSAESATASTRNALPCIAFVSRERVSAVQNVAASKTAKNNA